MIRNGGGATSGGGVRGGVAFFFQVGLSFPSSLGFIYCSCVIINWGGSNKRRGSRAACRGPPRTGPSRRRTVASSQGRPRTRPSRRRTGVAKVCLKWVFAICFFDVRLFSRITVFTALHQRVHTQKIVKHLVDLILLCQ